MSTPFSAYANAVLTFQRAIAAPEVDVLGNTTAITEDFIVTAYLKETKSTSKNANPFEGGQDNVVFVEGRCVDGRLPEDILPGMKAIAAINGVEGEFFLEAGIASAFGVDELLGGKLKGRFVTRVAFGDAL